MKLSRLALLSLAVFAVAVAAQTSSTNQIDASKQVALRGSVSVLAQGRYDRGAVADDFPVQRALVMLQPSPDREAALQRFLREAHAQSSADYHKWLTPEQYGARFGATDDDVAAVTQWLQASGFNVARVTKSKAIIEFSGTAAQVRTALHTEIHQYEANGKSFYANDREITVPAAIASHIRNFAPLNSVAPTNYLSVAGRGTISRETHRVTDVMQAQPTHAGAKPEFTTTADNAPFYALAPEDFATQYDLGPVYSAGTKGDGQTIGIIGTANLNLALVDAYRTLFNLPADHTNVIVDGEDPGDGGAAPDVEGFLDVEASGSVAPDAAIDYYIAGGQPLENGLALAALRAIEDNEAAVLSVSYGQCEQLLGNAGNQLWNGLWQQAAAQGQTVLVASGDSGPNTCPDIGVIDSTGTETISFLGPSVSGITSTPWNVSVGGTDFYYSDYATGGSSAATLWNQTNDASDGSLKASLPEQPWDGNFGLNANLPFDDQLPYGPAGGGGASGCSQSGANPGTPLGTCIAGYAKPAWQQAPGVPADGVRDVPDVALFAANGQNFSAWPICAEAGECSGTSPEVYLVGGTSASTPAMAGIMALVNQKYGRQGQANYTLYALAQQQASSFHDIAIGTNDVLCYADSPDCVGGNSSPTSSTSDGRYGLYAAGAGYDQATGLGSIDANLLLANWSKITTTASATTLQLSPVTAVHGTPVAVTVSVKASSGTGTPTGEVVLETTSGSLLRGNEVLTLSSGAAFGSVATLPGGTYSVVAQYGGNGVFAASTSPAVSVTVTPEASTAPLTLQEGVLTAVGFTQSGGTGAGTLIATKYTTISNGGQGVFGGKFLFQVKPSGQSSGSSGQATGTATFTDGGTTATVPVGVDGIAAWTPQTVALGAHSVTVAYSGDAGYAASTSAPLSFSVVQGTPIISAGIETQASAACTASQGLCGPAYLAGSSPLVHVLLRAPYAGVPPTGTVTATLGSVTQTVPLTIISYSNLTEAVADLTLPNVPAGTYTLTASYSGDANWNAASFTAPQQAVFVTANSASTTTTLSVASSAAASADVVTFNYTVTASSDEYGFAPSGLVVLLANGSVFASGLAGLGEISAPSLSESGSIRVSASAIPIGAQQIVAYYAGNVGFSPSTSGPVSLNVSESQFTLASGVTSVAVAAGKTVTAPLLLGTEYGLTVPVALSCTPSNTTFTCSLSSPTMSVSGSATATVTISAFTQTSAVAGVVRPMRRRDSLAPGAVAFACLVLLGLRRRPRWPLQGLLALLVGVCLVGCGGKGPSGGTGNQPPPPVIDTTAGTYSVVVQGTSGGVTHNVQIDVVVQ